MQASAALALMWKKGMEYVQVMVNVLTMTIVSTMRNAVVILYVHSLPVEETVVGAEKIR